VRPVSLNPWDQKLGGLRANPVEERSLSSSGCASVVT
jgi:hypothetical protein